MDPITIALKFEGKLPGEDLVIKILDHFDQAPPDVKDRLWRMYLEDLELARALLAPVRIGLLAAAKQLEAPNGTH